MEQERNRPGFLAENLRKAQVLGWEGLRRLQAAIRAGMSEEDARRKGEEILRELGAKKNWHRVLVRFGSNTLKKFNELSDPISPIQTGDIYFLDLGPVFEIEGVEYEADVGDTFVLGSDADKARIADAARDLFQEVAQIWRGESLSGSALYERARKRAQELGYELHPDVDGHRVGDFPHQVFFRGGIGEVDYRPSAGVWILEIQLRHPSLAYGAFFEDLLD